MAFIFQKFQEVLIRDSSWNLSPKFAKDPRHLQFEADMNRLFLYTSYNRLGKNADVADAEEIINMAGKASLADQQKQVQENIHSQVKTVCMLIDEILLPDIKNTQEQLNLPLQANAAPRCSGLSFAVGRSGLPNDCPVAYMDHGHGVSEYEMNNFFNSTAGPQTRSLSRTDISQSLKGHTGYTLNLKSSQIPHEKAGQGLFVSGEADVGAVVAFYPGVIYSPAYYRYIPGYPRVDAHNPYLITRYDGTVINAKPWGAGGETREVWNGFSVPEVKPNMPDGIDRGSDRIWKLLSKPLEGGRRENEREVLEHRNPLALGHFANHPAKGMSPNVMFCPYDIPLTETDMRAYIPIFCLEGKIK
ncbi:hypothetical protein HHK36_014575 [Tetracentron sinense]|uniref:Uncharacterized protein n=1 Tax=Tetracentron sinense TaxID=13715 RepID=A0A835DC29_TETSI|nr:hypothetical protein HHK36_014575 [Tetracentron sinense]